MKRWCLPGKTKTTWYSRYLRFSWWWSTLSNETCDKSSDKPSIHQLVSRVEMPSRIITCEQWPKPRYLLYVGDNTTQLYGDCDKPLKSDPYESNQYFIESQRGFEPWSCNTSIQHYGNTTPTDFLGVTKMRHPHSWIGSLNVCHMDVSLNGGTPNLHPNMITFSRKTHCCWVPPF